MAAPADKTIKNLSGKWALNKSLSDSAEPGLALQGIGYLVRKGVGLASITLDINQYEGPPKPPNTSTETFTHIDLEQSASGLSNSSENRCVDDTYRELSDWLFGNVKGKTNWTSVATIDDAHLKKGWEVASDDAKELIHSHVESLDNGWTADQVWGFQTVNGERRYCRNILIQKGGKRVEFRFVYDYTS